MLLPLKPGENEMKNLNSDLTLRNQKLNRLQGSDSKRVKISPDTVYVCKRKGSQVSAVCKQDKDALVIRINPTTRTCKP